MKKILIKKGNKWSMKKIPEKIDYISFFLAFIPLCYIIFQIVRYKV